MEVSGKKLIAGLLIVFILGVLFSVINGAYSAAEGEALPVVVYLLSLISLIVGAAVVILFQWKTNKNQVFKLLKLLPAEERIIVDVLLQNNNVLEQNRLVAESGLGKVKTSRVVSKLEQRGVIKKNKLGNTNLIRLTI